MLSDIVISTLITSVCTTITTIVVAFSSHSTRKHFREVKQDVKDIKEALYLPTESEDDPLATDRPAPKPQPFREP